MSGRIASPGLPESPITVERALPAPGPRELRTSAAAAAAPVPASGKPLPRGASVPDAPVDVEQARLALERFVRTMRRELEFRVDEDSGRTIITVRNKETGEIVRQIPPEELLALARTFGHGGAGLFDQLA